MGVARPLERDMTEHAMMVDQSSLHPLPSIFDKSTIAYVTMFVYER